MEFCYRCSLCGKHYDIAPELTVCPDCSRGQQKDQPLKGVLQVELSGSAPPDFAVSDLLPASPDYFPPIPVGNTPLWAPENIRKATGFTNLFIKEALSGLRKAIDSNRRIGMRNAFEFVRSIGYPNDTTPVMDGRF
jgi:hypothetical protein